jgi:CHAT domain
MEDHFELSILNAGHPSHAIAVARNGYDLAIENLSCAELNELMEFRSSLADAATGKRTYRPTVRELDEFGEKLFHFTVQHRVRTIYERLPSSHISLQIFSNLPDLQALPWEYFHQPGTIPGPNALRSVVRTVPTIGVRPPNPLKLGRSSVRIL